MRKNIKKIVFATFLGITIISCTDLNEEVLDGVRLESAETEYAINDGNPADLLVNCYSDLRGNAYQSQDQLLALNEHSSDAIVGPTRGGDWDDNGVWRSLHTHTYAPDHTFNLNTFVSLYGFISNCNFVLGASPSAQQAAEARFLRAMHYYHIVDLWGQAAYRELGSDPNANAEVWSRSEATDWIISELEAVINDLPTGDPTKANKNAAHWLLAKLYLNKGVFKAENPAGPYTFDNADLAKVVSNIDAISGVSLAADYWDNFMPANTETSTELILVSKNSQGGPAGNIQCYWRMTNHYNQNPSGWNGFTTLSDYYNMFDPNDDRILHWDATTTEKSGYNLGFQIGQQYGPGGPGVGVALKDRKENPLIFTEEVTLITGGNDLETAGIRGVKYIPDVENYDSPNDDYVIARYADALLMKAEALSRTGDNAGAQAIVRTLQHEATTTINSTDDILDVRGRELWWEGWRRNDMVRFGKFLAPMQLKEYESDSKYILMPIPAGALLNPNFSQNPGY